MKKGNSGPVATPPAAAADPTSARDRVLVTASRLFYEEGIRATGIDRVIAEAGVTKVTFYRHFPSKNDLVIEYLERRHALWMTWFREALARHGGAARGTEALVGAMAEWFGGQALGPFRGCAFLNGVGELGPTLPAVVEITRRHKLDMTTVIAGLLSSSTDRQQAVAAAISLAVDGAILQAQYTDDFQPALQSLAMCCSCLSEQPVHIESNRTR